MKEKKEKKEKKTRKIKGKSVQSKTDRRRADGTKPHHQPSHETRGLVRLLTAGRYSQEVIAKHMDISVDSLRRHYKTELEEGKILIEATAISSFLYLLEQKHPQITLFAMKAFLGINEKQSVEHTVQELPKLVINVGKPKRGNTDEEA